MKSASDKLRVPPAIIWTKLRTTLLGHVLGRIYIDTNHDLERSVIIAGTHRSGSTWLANLVNHQLHYRLIFEPFRHAKKRELKIHRRRYLRPGTEHDELRQHFAALLQGTERNYHLNRKNNRLVCHGRLLKDVSINLLLKWVRLEFPSVPIIYLIRSPFQVVHSCLSVGWLSPKKPSRWLEQEVLMADYLEPYRWLIAESETRVERFALEWCILNYVPLQQFQAGEWKLVSYRSLLRQPEQTLKEICAYLGIPYRQSVLEQVAVPSHTAEAAVDDRDHLLEKWKHALSESEVKVIERYTREFQLERYLGREL